MVEPGRTTIVAAELTEVRLPLRRPFTAREGRRTTKRILLLRLEATAGPASGVDQDARLTGWSECVALQEPGYTEETVDSAWSILMEHLLPCLPGATFDAPAELLDPASWIRGHRMAKATVEMAGWDLLARARGVSAARLVGSASRVGAGSDPQPRSLPVGVSLGFHDRMEDLLTAVAEHRDRGYARIKVKIGPGRDREILSALRERFGGGLDLWADANGAYDSGDMDHLPSLDDFGLVLLEQPFPPDDLIGHARLQERMETAVCLDESIESVADLETALELGACRIVNVKPGRVGGLTEAIAIHDRCVEEDVHAWVGGMLEGGVGRAHNLALASLPGFSLPGDLSESARYFHRDIVDPPFVLESGSMPVPTGPGIGVRPDLEYIESLKTRSARFE